MKQERKNTLLVAGIVAGLVSLPLTWFKIPTYSLEFDDGFGGMFDGAYGDMLGSAFGGMMIPVSGLSGSLELLVLSLPIWLVVGLAIAAGILQLMRASRSFDVPLTILWTVPAFAFLWLTLPVVAILFSGQASLGLGWVLGVFSAAVPLYCFFKADAPQPQHHAPVSWG